MSIMQESIEQVQGFEKEIDQGAIGLILDNLQQYQYEYPQKSAIRELVSNGLDAIREKQIALQILSGKAKEEDFFIRRGDDLNKDSNFDREYYDLDWIWNLPSGGRRLVQPSGYEPDKVYVTYEEGDTTGKDKVIIEDFGVGMGGKRIEGYFKIGYSTKRNTKEALGKFGIGAKAGLSTAPFYTMVSRYNGREYVFNIYPHNIQSIVPALNLETGKPNGVHVFSNGAKIYYRDTKLPNGVRVELESKKHHKHLYMDAVKSQLLYFPNVEFRVKNSAGGMSVIPIQAEILYEDEHILLSDNTQFSRPHILISRINYGVVDFRELELEDVQGNIAFKIPQEEVTVKPSRESLVWNEVTRKAVMSHFQKIKGVAERMVSEQLKDEDFVEWLIACSQIQSRYASDSIVGRLSRLVDMSNAKIGYSKDPSLIYGKDLFGHLNVRMNILDIKREGSTIKYQIKRNEGGIITAIADGAPIYMQRSSTSFRTDKYLLMHKHKDIGFITIRDPFSYLSTEDNKWCRGDEVGKTEMEALNSTVEWLVAKKLDKHTSSVTKADMIQHGDPLLRDILTVMRKVTGYLLASPLVRWYDEVVVPEDFNAKEEVEDEKTVEEVKAKEAREKIKREKGVIPIFTPRNVESSYITAYAANNGEKKLYEWQKLEMPVTDIDNWDEEEVFFGNDKDMELMNLAAVITRPEADKLCSNPMEFTRYKKWEEQTKALRDFVPKYLHGVYDKTSGYAYTPTTAIYLNSNNRKEPQNYYYGDNPVELYGVDIKDVARCHNFFETFGKPSVKLIKVAMDRVKFFLDFKPIQRFFMDVKGKTLTMSNALIRWNTARLIQKEMGQLRFLNNFELFHGKYYTWYQNLKIYVDKHYREVEKFTTNNSYYGLKEQAYTDLLGHMEKVTQLQLFVRQHTNEPEKVAELVKEMFNPSTEITDGQAIDIDMYDKLKELLEFARPISTLLNDVNSLTLTRANIPEALEHEIRFYLDSKGIDLSQKQHTPTKTEIDNLAKVQVDVPDSQLTQADTLPF